MNVIAVRRIEVNETDLEVLKRYNALTKEGLIEAYKPLVGIWGEIHSILSSFEVSIYPGDLLPLNGNTLEIEDELEFEIFKTGEDGSITIDADHIPLRTINLRVEFN